MSEKLEPQDKHIINLIVRDCGSDGWASVSDPLFLVLSENIPSELVEFEKLKEGGRARLTEEGKSVHSAMAWL